MKVMSAVQQRLYESFTQELHVLFEIVKDYMLDEPYPFALADDEQNATREVDYTQNIDIIPVADPNASTMAQRIMQMQAITQLMQQNGSIYDQKAVHRAMIRVLGSEEAEIFIPTDEDVQPTDPVTENMNLLNMKPVKAGADQNHEAHIQVHMAAIQDPKMQAIMANNPASQAILAAAAAHIQEHIAFEYRKQIELELGVPLPPPGEPLPSDIEYQLADLSAKAADKLLNKNTMEQKAMAAQQAANDPVLQAQQAEIQIKAQAQQDKKELALANIGQKEADRRMQALLAIFKEMSETERSTLAVEVQKGLAVDKQQLEAAKAASDMQNSQMAQVASLLVAAAKAAPMMQPPAPPAAPVPGGPVE
jgi:hypothetical protein